MENKCKNAREEKIMRKKNTKKEKKISTRLLTIEIL